MSPDKDDDFSPESKQVIRQLNILHKKIKLVDKQHDGCDLSNPEKCFFFVI